MSSPNKRSSYHDTKEDPKRRRSHIYYNIEDKYCACCPNQSFSLKNELNTFYDQNSNCNKPSTSSCQNKFTYRRTETVPLNVSIQNLLDTDDSAFASLNLDLKEDTSIVGSYKTDKNSETEPDSGIELISMNKQNKNVQTTNPKSDVNQHDLSLLSQHFLDLETTLRTSQRSETKSDRHFLEFENSLFENVDLTMRERVDESFYGLPEIVKAILKSHYGIQDLYDWQKECLALAMKSPKNLIYALPTSGGKTLVAEILMLREVVCEKKNALLILPYVAVVQEKIARLCPLAVALNFLLEEYTGGKGKCPPRKRRKKNSIFICTIEKGSAVFDSLCLEKRLEEIGLIVIDELHLMGESERGAKMESFIARIKTVAPHIRIVAMSATIGNLEEIASFLNADLYLEHFRPVQLDEYLCCNGTIAKVNEVGNHTTFKILATKISRKCGEADWTEQMEKTDPEFLTPTILEVIPEDSCLVFCPTKQVAQNVVNMIGKIVYMAGDKGPKNKLLNFKSNEKRILIDALQTEGMECEVLRKSLPLGIVYHHSGLTSEERRLIEEAYRNGVICVICATTTLAAGVNLPARRVIIRSPFCAMIPIKHSLYKQMVGRAGRTGLAEKGESFIFCKEMNLREVIAMVNSPMDDIVSQLGEKRCYLKRYLLSSVVLGLANTDEELIKITEGTLFALQADNPEVVSKETSSVIEDLRHKNVLTVEDEILKPSTLGAASMKAGVSIECGIQMWEELNKVQENLVLNDMLQLLYLVIPLEMEQEYVIPKEFNFLHFYENLSVDAKRAAENVGLTERVVYAAARNGKLNTGLPSRLYRAMMLRELWNGKHLSEVANKYGLSRGTLHIMISTGANNAARIVRFCEPYSLKFWPLIAIMTTVTQRLSYCTAYELHALMELPAVRPTRARQLYDAGYHNPIELSKTTPEELIRKIKKISRKQAVQIISAAKALLIEKLDSIREIAEDVMEGNIQPADLQRLQLNL